MKLNLILSGLGKSLILLVLCSLYPLAATAAVDILNPPNGYLAQAEPCPNAPCGIVFGDIANPHPAFEIRVTGEPVDFVHLDFVEIGGTGFSSVVCTPPDPIEQIPGCATPPVVFSEPVFLNAGNYTVTARATRGASVETSLPINVVVTDWNGGTVGPVSLTMVDPNRGAPGLTARGNFPSGVTTIPDTVRIHGDNLQNNPFLRVFLAPIPFGEPDLTAESALPAGDWCLYEAEIINRNSTGDTFLEVRLPELPSEGPTSCGVPATGTGSVFQKNWRWVIRDPWIRPEREHRLWAIPSPRDVPWKDAPPFQLEKPAYPLIDGFGFDNHGTGSKYYEFLTVYGNNAYYCVGALGLCATRIPKPLYHTMWWGIYKLVIDNSGGSCNGMSSTSLLMSQEKLQPEDYEADVHFPIGFDTPGPDSVPDVDKDGNSFMKGVARYRDSNFCTPLCSPPKPDNMWAEIRKNHGVQFSRQFLGEMFKTLGEAVFDIGDITSLGDEELFQGIPNATLEKIRANPRGNVLCFTSTAGGHCVTPYKVEGNRIHIYDNNEPGDDTRFIDIVGGDYDYPARSKDPNHGNFIIAYPIDIWENGRSLWGLGDFLTIDTSSQALDFLAMIVAGSADMVLTNDDGERFGWEDDGSFNRSMAGAMTLPGFGPSDQPNRNGMFFVSASQPGAGVVVNADGGLYAFHTGSGNQLFQIEATHAQAGDKDRIDLARSADRVQGFSFSPQRDADGFVARAGMDFGNEEGAVFSWLGLTTPGGETSAFWADRDEKSAGLVNQAGSPSHYLLSLDYASGPADRYGRSIYGPFEVPAGATHTVRLESWPETDNLLSELDLDGDGIVDVSARVPGRPASPPLNPDFTADLVVAKQADRDSVSIGEPVTYTVTVTNAGPQAADGVKLVDSFPAQISVGDVYTDRGGCIVDTAGLSCDLGSLWIGESATVTYSATPARPGALVNAAFAHSDLDDPDWTNNTALVEIDVPVAFDIKPGNRGNLINPKSRGVVPAAILGQRGFDVRTIDRSSLRFGPGQGKPAHKNHGHLKDVNHDGITDLKLHFSMRKAGIPRGDRSACVSGRFVDGRAFSGCDQIRTVPKNAEENETSRGKDKLETNPGKQKTSHRKKAGGPGPGKNRT